MTFAVTVFTSAFLLFQVQPIIARYILPWYGGSPAVWTICLLFFQLGLLLGYTYAHALVTYLNTKQQTIVHMLLLLLSVVFLPIAPAEALKPDGSGSPTLGIVLLLLRTVGLPYILISATGPLLQRWFATRYSDKSPYRLYALSNVGSLLALLTYPFLFERSLDLPNQTVFWSVGYGLFILVCGVSAFGLVRFEASEKKRSKYLRAGTKEGVAMYELEKGRILMWLGLSATGVVLLLAVTNQLSLELPVVALMWVVPLGLYLITNIIAFHNPRWYHRGVWVTGLVISAPAAVYLILGGIRVEPDTMHMVMGIYLAVMFFGCMVCHGELARLKAETEQLTLFYFVVALGGVLGGCFVGVLCPLVFSGYWELHLGIVLALALPAIAIAGSMDWSSRRALKRAGGALFLLGTTAGAALLANDVVQQEPDVFAQQRNFYGIIRVTEDDRGEKYHRYKLYHGGAQHGQQFQSKKRVRYPTSYYGRRSGVGIAIRKHPKRLARIENPGTGMPALHVGVVGMGIGTIAALARRRDRVRMYEVDPEIVKIANTHFSFLKRSRGSVSTVVGDGRISLEREHKILGSNKFDVLAVDAIIGNAVPTHIVTLEAGRLYKSHLADGGIIAFHISNRYVDLKPVLLAMSKELQMRVIRITNKGNRRNGTKYAEWILMTNNDEFIESEYVQEKKRSWPKEGAKSLLWTDRYSSVVELLK